MDKVTDTSTSPEYVFAEAEYTRKLKKELAALATKPRSGWYETIALALLLLAINKLLPSLSLSGTDQFLVILGFLAPTAALAGRLYNSEKRIELLIKLLSKDGTLKS